MAEAVRRVCALQAQTPASPYLALWNRVRGFKPEDLDAAFADRRVVKATLMRITLHAVHAEDYAPYHAAMSSSLRAARVYDRRFTSTGLTHADADALLPKLAGFLARPRTGTEVKDEVLARFGDHAHQRKERSDLRRAVSARIVDDDNLERAAGRVTIELTRPSFRQAWVGDIPAVKPAMGFINIIRPDFHLHLKGGSVSGWRRTAGEGRLRFAALAADGGEETGLVVSGASASFG